MLRCRGAILLACALGAASLHRLPATAPRAAIRPRAPRVPPPALLMTKQRGNEAKANGAPSGARADGPPAAPSGGVVAAGLASSAIIAEGVQLAGTAVLLAYAQQQTGADNPVETVQLLIDYLQALGFPEGYLLFAALMITLQVVPVAAAFLLTVSAGAIFGPVAGTATVLTCSTISASISFLISRSAGRELVLQSARDSPQFAAIDAAFERASFGDALTLITLLRLSPVLPFAWANYVFGLSGVPFAAFSLGTFLGCSPAVAAYVSAGTLGAEIVVNGSETSPWLLALGVAATLAAVGFAGGLANDALKEAGLDLEAD